MIESARQRFARLPWTLLFVVAALAAIGVAALDRAIELQLAGERLLPRQIVWLVAAGAAMLLASRANYRALCRYSYVFYAGAIALLVLVYFFPPVNGARRWIRLGPIGFQPSELAKLAFVLALSRWLMFRPTQGRLIGWIVPLLLALAPMGLIVREPDLGTALVFLPVFLAMFAAAGARKRDVAVVSLAALVCLPILWTQMSREQRSRVTVLFEQTSPGEKPTADGFHLHRAKQMLALGGVWGSVVDAEPLDDRAAYFVPEAATDSILTIVGERFGLVGFALVLLLYILLAWRGLAIAAATHEPFGRIAAVGVVALFCVPVAINAAMQVGLAPITGLSAPLLSYGGSGLLTHGLALGLLLAIASQPGYELAGQPFRYATAAA